ncbi:MAG: tRNA pseudouridine(55) synthase TruB [Limisphaerales bacterium]|jgi:tRNA pseudouridine55 synthase|nr:tRNA pseudouridine(55) synthase TruB [Verrucomicrobiota bacterium]
MVNEDSVDGLILIDKPTGCTSHDVVNVVRRRFRLRKVGHCGTLDPEASGLLLLVLGKATKLSDHLMGDDKTYEGTFKLGQTTDSYDADGEITQTSPVPPLLLADLNKQAATFEGDQMQIPPMVSAVKVKGVPLHKLARKGLEVERRPRLIYIYRYEILNYEAPFGDFILSCSKGVYVRSVVHDMGQAIGCGAHLTRLHRTVSGPFTVEKATPLEVVKELSKEELKKRVLPAIALQKMLLNLP